MALVSVVVPCYNCEKFVGDTIESVLNQTFENWELILVDDCSSDSTFEVISGFANKDSRIVAMKMPVNGGAGAARNLALDNARGQYIAFLDSDDVWFNNKLERQLDALKDEKYAICHTSYIVVDEKGNQVAGGVQASRSIGLAEMMKKTEIGMSTAMVNKKVIGEFRLSLIRNRQDAKLWMDILATGNRSIGIEEPLSKYRIRNGQVSSNKLKMVWITFKLYMQFSKIGYFRRFWYFSNYCLSAVLKRL